MVIFLAGLSTPVFAGNFSLQTGYYVGSIDQVEVEVGFEPDLVMVKTDSDMMPMAFKTSAMPGGITQFISASDYFGNSIEETRSGQISFTSTGFTAGLTERLDFQPDGFDVITDGGLSLAMERYQWIAVGGSDCSATGNFCVGSYRGDGAATQTISVGFQPTMVMVKRAGAYNTNFRTASMPANETQYLTATVRETTGALVQSFGATDFVVGATNNAIGSMYYYVAFKSTAGLFAEGSYTANNTDNRAITGLGFAPNVVVVKNGTNATAGNTHGVFHTSNSYGDYSSFFQARIAAVNNIQSLLSDGFQVGTSIFVNGSASNTQYYFALGGASAIGGASGTFTMDSGTYTGNGTTQAIKVDFAPDLVIVKSNNAEYAVMRTSLMKGNKSGLLASWVQLYDGLIVMMNESGFVVGNDPAVNQNGATVHWQAFGNAYDPVTRQGAADFMVGAYTGSGLDDRLITQMPFQPDLVVVKGNGYNEAVWKSSAMAGDWSGGFGWVPNEANHIQALSSEGFQIGTSDTVNSLAYEYHWFAFKEGSTFSVGSYTGNYTDNRNITGVGFQPDLVWVKAENDSHGVFRSSTLAGDNSQFFSDDGNASNCIQQFISDGFQVGTCYQANDSGIAMQYAAWKLSADPTNLPGTPGNPSYAATSSNATTISWSSASNATSYVLERALDVGGSPYYYMPVTTTTETSYTDTKLTTNTKYWYRVAAKNSNGIGNFSTATDVTTTTQTVKVKTGSFIGNGENLSISGIGFRPDFVMAKSDSYISYVYYKSSLMDGFPHSKISQTGYSYDNDWVINNDLNVRYTYLAIAGSDCSTNGVFCVGMYVGDGTSSRTISTGFNPDFVWNRQATDVRAFFQTASQPANETLFFSDVVRDQTGNYIKDMTTGGFTVGTAANVSGAIYHFIAFKNSAGFMKEGTYTANNTDNRDITGVGFRPSFVMVKNATNATGTNVHGVFSTTDHFGDRSSYFSTNSSISNVIQGLSNDGFQVGTSILVNGSASDTHYYVALGGDTTPAASGSFEMATGSYTGNGTSQTISGLAFAPDMVIIKPTTAFQAVFRTSLMAGDSTGYLQRTVANFEGGITELTSDGFSVGNTTFVNTNGTTYHWQAFGNAYDPHTHSGAADFALGTFIGNSVDNRTINKVPFDPDLVVIKTSTNGYEGVWKSSELVGDLAGFFGASAETSNLIQALNADGFEVGSGANRAANYDGYLYHWFAFKEGLGFDVGTYTGNATDNRDITTVGFQPDLVWVFNALAQSKVFRSASIAGDSTFYFNATANAADRIQSLIATGFQIGGNRVETNTNLSTYRYAAWRNPPETVVSISLTSDGTVQYGIVSTSKSTIELSDSQTVQNDGNVAVDLNIKSSNATGGTGWTIGANPGTNIFVHEYSTNSGSNWTKFTAADTYGTLTTGLAASASQIFDLRLTVPTTSSDVVQKSVSVTLQAVEQ